MRTGEWRRAGEASPAAILIQARTMSELSSSQQREWIRPAMDEPG